MSNDLTIVNNASFVGVDRLDNNNNNDDDHR